MFSWIVSPIVSPRTSSNTPRATRTRSGTRATWPGPSSATPTSMPRPAPRTSSPSPSTPATASSLSTIQTTISSLNPWIGPSTPKSRWDPYKARDTGFAPGLVASRTILPTNKCLPHAGEWQRETRGWPTLRCLRVHPYRGGCQRWISSLYSALWRWNELLDGWGNKKNLAHKKFPLILLLT